LPAAFLGERYVNRILLMAGGGPVAIAVDGKTPLCHYPEIILLSRSVCLG
jgi:hypothetical protein